VIVEEAPAGPPFAAGDPPPVFLLPLSARSDAALDELCRRYEAYLAPGQAAPPLGDVCRTAGEGRNHFEYRLAVLADSPATVRRLVAAAAAGDAPEGVLRSPDEITEPPRVGVIFSGEAPDPAVVRLLAQAYPSLRATLVRCAELLDPAAGGWLRSAAESAAGAADSPVQPEHLYPLSFAFGWVW